MLTKYLHTYVMLNTTLNSFAYLNNSNNVFVKYVMINN